MPSPPDRAVLESKERHELMQIAEALGVEIAPRSRKGTIIDAILAPAGAQGDPAISDDTPAVTTRTRTPMTSTRPAASGARDGGGDSAEPASRAGDQGGHAAAADSADTTTAGGADEAGAAGPDDSGADDADDAGTDHTGTDHTGTDHTGTDHTGAGDDVALAEEGNRRNRRRGRGREEPPIVGDTVHCDGLLDLRDEGYGFLRTNGPLPSADDVYVAARQVRQYDLRRGDRITGVSRPAARSERNPALLRLDTLNGELPPPDPERPLFDRLTPVHPSDALTLSDGATGAFALIDECAPVGLGSRGLLTVSGTRSASPLVAAMAAAIGDRHPDVHLIVLLIAERPEDVTEQTRRLETSAEVLASTFDRPPEEHVAVAELTLERTKRMAETGADVVILFDGLTRLARAYASGSNGRHQPADAVGAAIGSTLRFFGGARNLEEAGAITMLATARTATGNAVDEAVVARLREAASLEIALADGLPSAADLAAGRLGLDRERSFSLGEHR